MIYFDSGATTLEKPKAVRRAVASAIRDCASPGRGGYEAAMHAAEMVYACRAEAAELFETEPEQVVFTMNATHGLNLAIHSLVHPGDRVVVSGFEHNSVVRPLYLTGAEVVVAGRKLFDPVDTLAAFDQAITPQTKAVVCTHVSCLWSRLRRSATAAACRLCWMPHSQRACFRSNAPNCSQPLWQCRAIKVCMGRREPEFCSARGR